MIYYIYLFFYKLISFIKWLAHRQRASTTRHASPHRVVIALLAAFIGFTSQSAFAVSSLDRVVVFEDSYSDDGAGYGLTRAMVAHGIDHAKTKPAGGYWQGRWSNGPVAVEVLARTLGLPLSDYAIGGATSGRLNYHDWMNRARPTGTLAQVEDYLVYRPDEQAEPSALYVIFTSANDFFAREDFHEQIAVGALADRAAAHVEQAVRRLIRAGGRQFLIVGSVDLAHVPAVVTQNQQADATLFGNRFDHALTAALQKQAEQGGTRIIWFDHQAFTSELRAHADRHGLTHLNTPCRPVISGNATPCRQPDTYFYWDDWHPTRRVHQLLGTALAQRVRAAQYSTER